MAKKVFLFFLLFFIFPYSVLATDYYVSTSGSDSNPGTIDRPFGTLQKSANIAVAGDNVYIRGGTYNQAVTLSKSGTQTSPITISGYQNEKVILDGTNLTAYSMVRLSGDWIKISGLEIRNTTTNGAAIFLEGNHCTAENNQVHDNYDAAIHINGDHGLAQGNRVWNNGLLNENNKSGVSGGWPAIVSCVRNYNNPTPEYCTLRGNIVWGNWGEGISVFEQIYATLEDNISYNNQQNIYLSDTKYSVVQRNISYCTPGNAIDPYMTQNGLLVGDEKGVLIDGIRRTSSDNKILNNLFMGCDRNLAAGTSESTNNLYAYNTFVNSGGDASERANVLLYGGSCTNCRFINNLILQENSISITLGGGTGWQFSNNLWSKTPNESFRGTNDIPPTNPGLAKSGLTGPGQLTADYFKLTASSLAVDKAKVLSEVAEDYFGNPRGSFPDIGGYEYGGPPTPTRIPSPIPTIVLPWLKTSGNKIVTKNLNQVVLLKGVNILRSEWNNNTSWEKIAIPELAKWKGNIIVRGFASDPVNNNDTNYLSLLDDHVTLAQQNGMYLVFVWRSHEISGIQPNQPDASAQSALVKLAQRYKGISNVMYGLQVEPHGVPWSTLRPLFETMIDAIRAASAPYETLIMVPGANYSEDISPAITDPVNRPNVVYKPHGYHQSSFYQTLFGSAYDAGLPVFVGEFAPVESATMADINVLLNFTRTRGIGWAAWIMDYSLSMPNQSLVDQNLVPVDPFGTTIKNDLLTYSPFIPSDILPPSTPTPSCPLESRGDADCNGTVNILDFEIWRREFLGIDTTTKADFDNVGGVSILDFEIWRRGFLGQ